MKCPYCDQELVEDDTFGNADYCLNAIGYNPGYPVTRNPIQGGIIYSCENQECEKYQESFYTLECEDHIQLHEGYPC
jgi:hypothetical protein